MDTSFDLVALLKQQPIKKSHKIKPTQFVSVAGGVQKRLETNIKRRKTSRLSVFDSIRNISKCESPARPPLTEVQQKAEHRKQQLEKWKEEKEKKRKEAAAQKKKPFVAGVAHTKTFGPPPPPKSVPRTSGRITRSQALRQQNEQMAKQPPSFAPSNASFKPPQFYAKVPTLAPIPKTKITKSKPNLTFEPVLPRTVQTRSKTVSRKLSSVTETKVTRQQNDATKATSKQLTNMFQSSSSSDMDQPAKKTSFQSKPNLYRSNYVQHPKKLQAKTKTLQSSSSSDMEQHKPPSRVMQTKSIFTSSSSSDMEQHKPPSRIMQTKSIFTSSSSSDMEQHKPPSRIMQTKSIFTSSSSSDMEQEKSKTPEAFTPQKSTEQETSKEHTPNNKIPKSESSSEEKLRSPKADLSMSQEQIVEELKYISPHVTMSRGKDKQRKEMKKKRDEGLLDEDSSNLVSVNHFRRQLDSETARITAMCDAWDKIFAQTSLPEPIQELVLTAVGQGRLLVSQKMKQFSGLVERCARPGAAPGPHALVTPDDLHGFWDMLFMQVENVDMRFKKLEELRACDWTEAPRAEPPPRRARAPARARPHAGPSRLRDMIAAARKAKKEQESQSEHSESGKSESSPAESKTFEAGFFSVSSPVRKPVASAPATPSNSSSLLKSVLSSEARKASASHTSTSFAMLRASLLSKNVDIEGVSPLVQTPTVTQVNLFATPARSILKQANLVSTKKSDRLKTVLFHDTEEHSSPASYASCEVPAEVKVTLAEEVKDTLAEEVKDTLAEEVKENKPISRRRSRLSRQSAVESSSPIMTRSRRKSSQTPFAVTDVNVPVDKRNRKKVEQDALETPKRTTRKSAAVGTR